jgi:type IV secretory pathway VirB10-like protein
MSDPTRWNKDPQRRPLAAEVLLRGARRPRPPGANDLSRLDLAVAQIPRRSALAARRSSRLATAAAAAIVVASLGTAVWALRGRRLPVEEQATVPVAVSVGHPPATAWLAPRPVAPPSEAPRAEVAEVKSVTRRSDLAAGASLRAARRARPPQTALGSAHEASGAGDGGDGGDRLTREIALIDAARSDVKLVPARALAAVDAHRREFPRGQLAAEREFLAVEALRRLDRTEEARRRADQLRVDYPSSSYAARASRLLQSAP